MNIPTALVLVGLTSVAGSGTRALGQHPDLSGRWKFNATQSDNPRDRLTAPDSDGGQERRGGYPGMGGRGGGFGGFGGGRGGFGGGRGGFGGRGGVGPGMSDEQRQRMRHTLQLALAAPPILAITASDSTVKFAADSAHAVVLYVDGRKLKQHPDSGGDIELQAHWQGNDFVVERKVSGGGKVTEDYLRSPDGKQLFVIVSLDTGRRTLDFRRVYDPAPAP